MGSPVKEPTRALGQIASAIDAVLNGQPGGRTWAFTVMVLPFGRKVQDVAYVSNAALPEMIEAMRHFVAEYDRGQTQTIPLIDTAAPLLQRSTSVCGDDVIDISDVPDLKDMN